jgi:hypothetical protein
LPGTRHPLLEGFAESVPNRHQVGDERDRLCGIAEQLNSAFQLLGRQFVVVDQLQLESVAGVEPSSFVGTQFCRRRADGARVQRSGLPMSIGAASRRSGAEGMLECIRE